MNWATRRRRPIGRQNSTDRLIIRHYDNGVYIAIRYWRSHHLRLMWGDRFRR